MYKCELISEKKRIASQFTKNISYDRVGNTREKVVISSEAGFTFKKVILVRLY